MLLLDTTRKPYMGSPMTLIHVTFSDPERSKSWSLRFRRLICRKCAKPKKETTYGESNRMIIFDLYSDLERSMSRLLRF